MLSDIVRAVREFLYSSQWFWGVVSALFALDALVLLCQTASKARKREWSSFWYILLCLAVFAWSGFSALYYFGSLMPNLDARWLGMFGVLRYVGYFFAPALLCLHVWKQVSYRELRWYHPVGYLAAPLGLTVWLVAQLLAPSRLATLQAPAGLGVATVVFYLYFAAMEFNSFMFAASVLYQMPQHMRGPARYIMAGVLAFGAAAGVQALAGQLPYDVMLVAAVLLLHILRNALRTVSSDNVILTSRELVLQNLSTVVLVLNRKGRIMDWNTKGHEERSHLPQPRYREALSHYRARMMAEGGRESPHDDSIVTFSAGEGEVHYHLTAKELRGEKRLLGYLVEVSDITRVYSVFRKLEETATIDQLTGLHNRNAYLAQAIPMAVPQNLPLLVMVGDVNNLKPINDTLGHLAGDTLLTSVSAIIRENLPPGSFAARVGGDEFVVLAPHCDEEIARVFVENSNRACLELPGAGGYQPGVSWGYAVMRSPSEDYNDVFGAADAMMYNTKKQVTRFRSSGLVPDEPAPAPAQQAETLLVGEGDDGADDADGELID